jgi:hypothetical protein
MLLPHGVKVCLHSVLLVRTGKVCRELCAQLTQDRIDPGVRFMRQVRAGPVKATWK